MIHNMHMNVVKYSICICHLLPHQTSSLWGFLPKCLSQVEDLFEVRILERQELEVQQF